MKSGSRLIVVAVMAGLLVSCSSSLRQYPDSRFLSFIPPAERLIEANRFAFHHSDTRGSVLVEGWLQHQFTRLLENKGYVHDRYAPQFTLDIDWDVKRIRPVVGVTGYIRPAAVTTAWGTYVTDSELLEEIFEHTVIVNMRDAATLQSLWSHSSTVLSSSPDVRTTSMDLLKHLVDFLPTHGTEVREAEFLPDPQFDRYATRNVIDRDFTLPGLASYITISEATTRKEFNPDDVRAMMNDSRLLAMFVDMLEHAVHYRVDENGLLEIVGQYTADGQALNLLARAQFDGLKYRITEMRNLGSAEFAALQEEIIGFSQFREDRLQVFQEVKTPRWQIVLTDSMIERRWHSTVWYPPEGGIVPDSVRFPADGPRVTPWNPYPIEPMEDPDAPPPPPYSLTHWYPPEGGIPVDSVLYPYDSERVTPWNPPHRPMPADSTGRYGYPYWYVPTDTSGVPFDQRTPWRGAGMAAEDSLAAERAAGMPPWYNPEPDSVDYRQPKQTPWYPPVKNRINR